MYEDRYQNSHCLGGFLHDFRQVKTYKGGVIERCTRCGDQMHFPMNTPNDVYLSFHIRSALQTSDPLYYHEYPVA